MVEDRRSLISRAFSSSRLFESRRAYMHPEAEDFSESKLQNGKRALNDDGELKDNLRPGKSVRLMGFTLFGPSYYASNEDQARHSGSENGDNEDQAQHSGSDNGDNEDQVQHSSSDNGDGLLNGILGRDGSLSCLMRCSRSDYGSIACLNRSFRDVVKSGEIYRLRRVNQIVEHWVYFSCQLCEWVAFNPVERKWMNLPTMPSGVTFMFTDKESLAVGTELLVLGKEDIASHVIYRYSLLTNAWSSGTSMNTPRCLFGSASSGVLAIFAGGCDILGKTSDSAEMYNSELQTWTTLPRMKKPRKMCSGVFMDGKFYVIGGISGTDAKDTGTDAKDIKVLTCGEEYDFETKKWTEIPEMSPPRGGETPGEVAAEAPPLVAVVNNQLYAADHADMNVRKYDKETKKWFTIGRLPERANSVNGWGIAFRACGERLIVIGGPSSSGGGFIELNSWIPKGDRSPPVWKLLSRKHSSNFIYNCAVMGC